MSNWIDYNLDVLAGNPVEINQIAERLKQPSTELVNRIAEIDGQPASEIAADLKELVEFKTIKNLGYVHPSVNKARRFSNSFKHHQIGVVDSHLHEVSEAFPSAIFLLEYRDMQFSYSGKSVIRAGEVVQHIHDGKQKAQGVDWVLLDIFAPFRAEYFGGPLEFGSLWNQWVDDVIAAAQALKHSRATAAAAKQIVNDPDFHTLARALGLEVTVTDQGVIVKSKGEN